jgi:hypothetical protein
MKKIPLFAVAVLICGVTTFSYSEEGKAVNRSPFSFLQGFFLGDEYVEYQRNLQKIEDQYKKGEISKDKYLELKADAKDSYDKAK